MNAAETKTRIQALEIKLLDAFMHKDLGTIDQLLHNDAVFIYPNGLTVTKAMVLENYRSGNSAFSEIISTNQIINIIDDSAVVSMNLELKGNYFDQEISSHFRYIRVWKLVNGEWKVIAVSGVPFGT